MPIPQMRPTNQSWRDQKRKNYKSIKYKSSRPKKSPSFKPKKTKSKGWKGFIFSVLKNPKFLKFAGISFIILILVGFIFYLRLLHSLPEPGKLIDREVPESTKIYDRTGEHILYDVHGEVKRTFVPLDEIPDYVKWAVIALEDKDFYKHGGFSPWAILRAIITRKGGGSTLTQQFTKNTILYNEENRYIRKIKEWILTPKIEKEFTKDQILEMYLNEMPFGSTAYGVEAASQLYFGKSVRDINIPEAAILAAIIQAPSRYSPYGPNKDILIGRQQYDIDLMLEQGYIPEAKAEAAKLFSLEFKAPSENITAPHFVMYVKDLLSQEFNYSEKTIEQGGLKIYTTLDLYKQKIAEEIIKEQVKKNEANYNASNAALVSIDPKNGQILAMVGSRDFFDEKIDGQVNVTTSLRQPGSSIKPLVYAAAFEKGYTPNTILYDVVTNFSASGNPYEPKNYDLTEHGPVSIRKALAGSLNIPAVKVIYLAGINNVLDLAEKFGYTSLNDRDRFGLSLVLGGGEIKLLEHTNAFGAFAREGEIHPITSILKIEDKNGKTLFEAEEKTKKVIDAKYARMINSILSDNSARAYAFGENNWLTLNNRPVAAKTGTTNDYRDAWTIGYTPSIVTGVWVGNNDNSKMKRGAGGSRVAAPIWNKYMKKVLGDTPVEYFKELNEEEIKTGKPIIDGDISGGEKIKIDIASGLLATEYTPENYIVEKRFAQHHCILYYIDKNNPLGDPPKKPEKDPQFELWESRVLAWAAKEASSTVTNEAPPTEYDNLHIPENFPDLKILYPSNNQILTEPNLKAEIETSAPRGVSRVDYYIDNALIASNNVPPYNLNKNINFLGNGFHTLKIRSCDDIDNCTEKNLNFNLKTDQSQKAEKLEVSILEPINSVAYNNIDFPLVLKAKINNPSQTAKIVIHIYDESGEKINSIDVEPVRNSEPEGLWRLIPPSGTYQLQAEAIGWLGQNEKSEKITITVMDYE